MNRNMSENVEIFLRRRSTQHLYVVSVLQLLAEAGKNPFSYILDIHICAELALSGHRRPKKCFHFD